ncbi:helix-turn-helix domain-containing protein [Haladaptatus sp. NG-SE-30]
MILFAVLLCLPGFTVALPTENLHGENVNGTTNTLTVTATTNITTTPKSTVSQSKANAPVIATTAAVSDVSTTADDANESDWTQSTTDPETTTLKKNGTTDTTNVGDTPGKTNVSGTTGTVGETSTNTTGFSSVTTTSDTNDTVEPSENVDENKATPDAVNNRPVSTGNSFEGTKPDSITTNAVNSERGNAGEVSNTVVKKVGQRADNAKTNAHSGLDIASKATGGVIEDNLINASPRMTKTDENVPVTVEEKTARGRSSKPIATASLPVAQSEKVESNTVPNTTAQLNDTTSGDDANADGTMRTTEVNDPGTHPNGSVPATPAHPTKTAELIGVTVTAGVVLHHLEIGTLATHAGTVSVFPRPKVEGRVWWPFMPLRYSKYDDSDPLEQEVRAELYNHIERTPGTYLSQLDNRMNVSLSTIRHHLRILEDEKIVTNAKIRGKRRYYPASDDKVELRAALAQTATAAVLDGVSRQEPVTVGELADELDRDPSTVTYHLKRLAEDGLVERKRNGRTVYNQLTSKTRAVFSRQPSISADD